MFSLIDMLGRACPTIDVVDVGAAWCGMELLAYRSLVKKGVARVVGFEPVPEECDRLNRLAMKHHRYLPLCVGDGSDRTLHVNSDPITSSLFPPITRLLRLFQQLPEVTTTVRTVPVKTVRIDEVPEIASIDYLKCDVQGADLDVLRGAENKLAGATVVEVEVEFAPLYEGQPLFADVDVFMRSRGFVLHTFNPMHGRAFRPVVAGGDATRAVRQVLWTDAIFVKDFLALGALTPEQLLKMAVVLHEVYGSVDLAQLALHHPERKTGAGLWGAYITRLTGRAPTETPPVD